MDEALLDKLPFGKGRHVYIEDHWSQDERDKILEDIARLGVELRRMTKTTLLSYEAGELSLVRGEIAYALLAILKVLMPVYGPDALWPVAQTLDTFVAAHKGSRHWLVTFKGDRRHLPQRAPYREIRKVMAAAVLEYFAEFKTELSMNQCTIAARIANAMTAGGFKVQTERNKQISSRTVQDWKILYASGKRPRRKKRDACVIKAFEEIVKLLKKGRGEKSAAAYFEEALADITMRCRHHSELFPGTPFKSSAKGEP